MINPNGNHYSITWLICFCIMALLIGGCVETRRVSVNPTILPDIGMENKFPPTAALVIDNNLKEYGISVQLAGGSGLYGLGEHLPVYAENVARNLFRQVTVYDSLTSAANKADVILIPKAVRSAIFVTNPIRVFLCVEWTVKDGPSQQTLWLKSIESEDTEPPSFGGKSMQLAFQRVFDDLSLKTLKSFRESPETSYKKRDQGNVQQ